MLHDKMRLQKDFLPPGLTYWQGARQAQLEALPI